MVAVVQYFFNLVLSPINEGGRICLILLEMVLTLNLHLEQLLAPLAFSQTFLLCSTTAFSLVFFGLSLFLEDLMPFSEICSYTFSIHVHTNGHHFFPSCFTVSSKSIICIRSFVNFLSINFSPNILLIMALLVIYKISISFWPKHHVSLP